MIVSESAQKADILAVIRVLELGQQQNVEVYAVSLEIFKMTKYNLKTSTGKDVTQVIVS